jgi:hypothetical protein
VGKYEHQVVNGGVGHNLRQEAPADARGGQIDMKLEVITIPSRMSTARRSSMGVSGGGSTPTSATAVTAWSSSRLRAPSARLASERRPRPPRPDPHSACT